MLVAVECDGVMGLLSGHVQPTQGRLAEASPFALRASEDKLADPGLYYAALSGLVCGGA